MAGNLPPSSALPSNDVRQVYNKFFTEQITFSANEIDATVGFFQKRGFDTESARSTAIVLLNQARIDDVKIFTLLDSMKVLTDIQLSQLVAQVLNAYREKTSVLGYRVAPLVDLYEARNILV